MVIPVPLIRRNIILRKLQQARAFTPGTAVTLREAGVFNPDGLPQITERMVDSINNPDCRMTGSLFHWADPPRRN